MEVDTSEQSVETLGVMVPNLQQLKLNNSTLKSFRDLGTSLRNLQCLWLSRSGIVDLDGIGALLALKELYVSFNDISDLTPLAMHDELQVLGTLCACVFTHLRLPVLTVALFLQIWTAIAFQI
jgi:Leucine-rich repeat (LRR) protein